MERNWCQDGGFLVGADHDVTSEPSEFFGPGLPAILGCGRIRCSECGALVRQIPGRTPREGVDAAEIYSEADWAVTEALTPEDPPVVTRYYACRCLQWIERSERPLRDTQREPDDPVFPWMCDGHPVAELPLVIDGALVTVHTDFAQLCRSAFVDGAPETARAAERWFATGWVRKVLVRLTGTTAHARMVTALASLLDDPDPKVRGCALVCFETLPELDTGGILARIAGDLGDPRWDVEDPTYPGRALRDRAIAVLARRIASGATAAEEEAAWAALEGVADPGRLGVALAARDPDRLLATGLPWDAKLRGIAEGAPDRLAEAAGAASAAGAEIPLEADEARAGIRAMREHGYAVWHGHARALLRSREPGAFEALARVARGRSGPALATHLAALCRDDDPEVRGGALAFLADHPDVPDRGGLAAALDDPRNVRARNSWVREALDATAARALAVRFATLPTAMRERLRQRATAPLGAGPVIAGLAVADLRWVLENVAAILAGTPAVLPDVLTAVRAAGRPVQPVIVAALRHIPPRFVREAIVATIPEGLERVEALTLVPDVPARRPP